MLPPEIVRSVRRYLNDRHILAVACTSREQTLTARERGMIRTYNTGRKRAAFKALRELRQPRVRFVDRPIMCFQF
jgi:hypothetical protein